MKLRVQFSIVALPLLLLTACETLDTKEGDSVSARVYNREMTKQGFNHYCGDGRCDSPPTLVIAAAPKYPVAALRAGQTGQASVVFYIDEIGSVSDAKLESATSPEFGQAALQAVQSWKYRPATLAGEPVEIGPLRQTIPFSP